MPVYLHQPAHWHKMYPAMHIFKMMQHQSTQKIVTTITPQTCLWPVAFQPWLGNTTENNKRKFRSGFFWNLQLLLGSSTKTSYPKRSEQCVSHFLISPGKLVIQRTLWQQMLIWFCTTWSKLNLLKEDYSRPTPHNQTSVMISVWFMPKDHKKRNRIYQHWLLEHSTQKSWLF